MTQSAQKENIMKYRLIYSAGILFVYILGKCIPLYGIELPSDTYRTVGVEEILMQTVGGDMNKSSIFALGIFPFMISSLFVQIAFAIRGLFVKTRLSPRVMGRTMVTVTLAIAIMQAFAQVPQLTFSVAEEQQTWARGIVILQMITGVMVILWLSERNGKYGVGGRMILGLVNILERVIATVLHYDMESLMIPLLVSLAVLVITLVMENAELRIPVQRVSIHNIYADKNYMAIKLNPVGVMPLMFSTMVFILPKLLVSLLGYAFPENEAIIWWQENMNLTSPAGIAVYIACEYLLTISLSLLMISPKDLTEQFLKSGDSIVNLHAGRDTKRYLRRAIGSISFVSATIMGGCILVPLLLQLRGTIDSSLTTLPTSIMMMTSFWCTIFRELASIYKYDSCRPLF